MATQAQIDAAFAALKALEEKTVPGWEQAFISDQLLTDVATIVIDAAKRAKAAGRDPVQDAFADLVVYRSAKVPFWQQGSVTDDVLRACVSTVLGAVKV
jgi:hypothetical protein